MQLVTTVGSRSESTGKSNRHAHAQTDSYDRVLMTSGFFQAEIVSLRSMVYSSKAPKLPAEGLKGPFVIAVSEQGELLSAQHSFMLSSNMMRKWTRLCHHCILLQACASPDLFCSAGTCMPSVVLLSLPVDCIARRMR